MPPVSRRGSKATAARCAKHRPANSSEPCASRSFRRFCDGALPFDSSYATRSASPRKRQWRSNYAKELGVKFFLGVIFFVATVLTCGAAALADQTDVDLHVGTLGYGPGITVHVDPHTDYRFEYSYFQY